MKQSVISFDQHGGMSIDHTGFQGKACVEATEALMKGLGGEIKAERKKPEMNAVTTGRGKTGQRIG